MNKGPVTFGVGLILLLVLRISAVQQKQVKSRARKELSIDSLNLDATSFSMTETDSSVHIDPSLIENAAGPEDGPAFQFNSNEVDDTEDGNEGETRLSTWERLKKWVSTFIGGKPAEKAASGDKSKAPE